MMKSLIGLSVFVSLFATFQAPVQVQAQTQIQDQSLSDVKQASTEFYQQRYKLPNIYDKLVNNTGDGYEPLYGTRNVRVVLNGVVYRGGANNAYNKHGKRNNSNPLPNEGLLHLCQEGFGHAVYLYSTRFETAPRLTNCQDVFGAKNTVEYHQESVLSSDGDVRAVLKLVHERLVSKSDQSPIYLHCWNGWHASGFISTVILRQFCGFSASQGVAYWNKNTDGNNGSSYEGIRNKIRAYVPDPNLTISAETRAQVCPSAQ